MQKSYNEFETMIIRTPAVNLCGSSRYLQRNGLCVACSSYAWLELERLSYSLVSKRIALVSKSGEVVKKWIVMESVTFCNKSPQFLVDFKIYKFLDLNCLIEPVMAAALLDSIWIRADDAHVVGEIRTVLCKI